MILVGLGTKWVNDFTTCAIFLKVITFLVPTFQPTAVVNPTCTCNLLSVVLPGQRLERLSLPLNHPVGAKVTRARVSRVQNR